ncbi:hypothetical protein EVAR_85424_1 [Eumeta japonica]|uniref:Uncharacterized protein n=1 Tax=Eumeta variegata TaxID=151549 RepID=A0A4C1WJL7_EUMVA|nr:hypothetical protein EVAR_85424_1 [Eumeta japonica]
MWAASLAGAVVSAVRGGQDGVVVTSLECESRLGGEAITQIRLAEHLANRVSLIYKAVKPRAGRAGVKLPGPRVGRGARLNYGQLLENNTDSGSGVARRATDTRLIGVVKSVGNTYLKRSSSRSAVGRTLLTWIYVVQEVWLKVVRKSHQDAFAAPAPAPAALRARPVRPLPREREFISRLPCFPRSRCRCNLRANRFVWNVRGLSESQATRRPRRPRRPGRFIPLGWCRLESTFALCLDSSIATCPPAALCFCIPPPLIRPAI